MKKKWIGVVLLSTLMVTTSCAQKSKEIKDIKPKTEKQGEAVVATVNALTTADFIEKIYDFKSNPQTFVYKGSEPCIIDFYANWCRPCKMLAPMLEEIAKQHSGKIRVYKVDVEQNQELSQFFQISSIPFLLFIPVKGQPAAQPGLPSQEDLNKIVNEFLLEKK